MDRLIFTSPLGDNIFELRALRGHEHLSRLFSYQLDLFSADDTIKHTDLLGQPVNIALSLSAGTQRNFNGYVSRFALVGYEGRSAHYQATLVPWLWFLTRTADCRIFQNMTVPDIIKGVLQNYAIADYSEALTAGYRTWDYCVQYRETDFAFISRLMEQEGIYYFFRNAANKHTLVLADAISAHTQVPGYAQLPYQIHAQPHSQPHAEQITRWQISQQVQPGVYAQSDFNFQTPQADLSASHSIIRTHALADLEVYDYPGEYTDRTYGDNYARIRIEEFQADYETAEGRSTARGLTTGALFDLSGHPRADQNREYLVIATKIEINEHTFDCQFSAIESGTPFRAPRRTPLPIVRGPQTAIVVGPAGEEIHTDRYGRVKVQFHWDRQGQQDANSSGWLRVAQSTAGDQWGAISTPRIGDEVIVSFVEGDPDRPIITGRVYNGDSLPPYPLPDKQTITGLKTRSSKGGDGYNEYSMDDSKGNELIREHAQFDKDSTIEHDLREQVGHDVTRTVNHDDTLNVGHNRSETVGAVNTLSVGGSYQVNVGGAVSEQVGSTHTAVIGTSSNESVGKSKTVAVGSNFTVQVGKNLELSSAKSTIIASGDNLSLISGKKALFEVADQLTIKCGKASITLKKNGDIAITGKAISIKSAGKITIKGQKIVEN